MDLDLDAYRLLFEAHPRPMYVSIRETFDIVLVNQAFCDLYGWTHEEACTLTLHDIRPEEEKTNFAQAYNDTTKTRSSTYSRATRHRTKSGRIIDITLEISALQIGGKPAGLCVVTDVTGIHDAERRFRLLVENSADGIVLVNANNVIEYVSPGSERILGYSAADVIGTNAIRRAHPDDIEHETAPAPGETRHYVTRSTHKDGTWRWIESTTTNLTHDPAIRAYVSNYRDVTQRKMAEDALVESEANFRALIERSPTATFVHREGRYIYVNPAAVAMLGFRSADEMIGRSVLDFIHPDHREMVAKRMVNTETTGGTPPGPGHMLRADGSTIIVEAEGIRLDFAGSSSNVVMVHDITQRHEMFARMATADRMLTVGTLAAGVAHEINNPLAYIGSNIDVLATELPVLLSHGRSRLTSDDFRSLVSDVREGVSRVSRIVRDLLALSRQPDETRGPVDLVKVLALSVKMAHNELRHRAQVVESYPDNLPAVDADASKLGQVFLNLLLNAAQAIEEGRADHNEVRVGVSSTDRGVVVEITDTGAGIPPDVMPRIFDPFFTTKALNVGTGLGLSITHQIVRSLGGEISVESALGHGTTFRVTLPRATGPCAEHAVEVAPPPVLTARVLVIDDEVAVGRALRMLLAPENDVTAVTTGQEALALLASERFDAILCDLMMPDISGIELYQQLVSVSPDCVKRIIFMTGGAFTPQARDFLSQLGRPHLDKPFTEGQLRHAIESVLG